MEILQCETCDGRGYDLELQPCEKCSGIGRIVQLRNPAFAREEVGPPPDGDGGGTGQ